LVRRADSDEGRGARHRGRALRRLVMASPLGQDRAPAAARSGGHRRRPKTRSEKPRRPGPGRKGPPPREV